MQSPCVKICKLKNNICIGCKRTLSEIKNWSSKSDEERNKIMIEIKERIKNNSTFDGI